MTLDQTFCNATEVALRQLALAALDRILGGSETVPGDALATIGRALVNRDDLDWRERRRLRQARRLFVMQQPPDRSVGQDLLLTQFGRGLRFDRLLRWLPSRTVRTDLQPVDIAVLEARALSAWTSAEFQRTVAARLHRALRGRVVMTGGFPTAPVLAPAFWWIAIGMVATPEPLAARLLVRGMARTGWAGFWEQVLLGDARSCGLALPGPLTDLPVLRIGPASLLMPRGARGVHPPDLLAPAALRQDWRDEAPDWAQPLLSGTM